MGMRSTTEGADSNAQCPVDDRTRLAWLEAAGVRGQHVPAGSRPVKYSLDLSSWLPPHIATHNQSKLPPVGVESRIHRLPTDREVSSIPRASPTGHLNQQTQTTPSNSEGDTGHDIASGNWIYPSQEMFFSAMKRKGHAAEAQDMASVVPIHNAVNEKAWAEIKAWEAGQGAESCGGPRLVSFSGDSKRLTPRARWNSLLGYQKPFDRHDWIVDRCGQHVAYVIEFYSGKDERQEGKSLNFYLDVRPKLNGWEGMKMRVQRAIGM